jgi:hypothetical protein
MIQEDLVALLGPTFSSRVYGGIAAEKTLFPYVVYQRIISPIENILDGNGNPPINQTRMQIDCWSQSYASAQAAAVLVRGLMKGWSVQNVEISEQDLYEFDTRLHRVLMDYSIWHYD